MNTIAAITISADAPATRLLRGWIQMGLRTGDFLAATLDAASGYGVDVILSTARADGTWVQVAASQPTIKGTADLNTTADISLAGRPWRLQIAASSTTLTQRRR